MSGPRRGIDRARLGGAGKVSVTGAELTLVTAGEAGKQERYRLEQAETTVGRAPDNMLVVRDPRVSRHHARILCKPDGYRVENLSRQNALLVNGEEVDQASLSHGDRIRMGGSTLRFLLGDETPADETLRPDCITIDARDHNLLLAGLDEHDLGDVRRAKSDLTSLYQAGQVLSASLSSSDLCDKTLELVTAHMGAVDCCSLHLLDPDSGELTCRASRFRSAEPEGIPHAFSRTILNQVLAEQKAVLSYDARGDDRFEDARSIASLSIRSAMCVPIQVHMRLTGVLQAHTLHPRHIFTVEDLKLLTAFGMMAGAAIEKLERST